MSVQDEHGYHDANREGWHEAQREKLRAEGSTDTPLHELLGVPANAATLQADRYNACPAHYARAVTPWDLQKCMKSSGNAFVDARRTDAIEYAFRLKDDLLGDLIKARHCLDEAITVLKAQKNK